jgi:hypothetical protein
LDAWLICVMPNHYHLVFRTRRANLSDAIHQLNGDFARWWNGRHGHVGHVFQARFKAQVIEHGVYLLRLCRYVLQNPARARLVEHPREWRWSSYHALVGSQGDELVDTQSLLAAIDPDNPPGSLPRLLDFVEGALDVEMGEFVRSDRRIVGSDGFAARFRQRARSASAEVPRRERRIGAPSLVQLLSDALDRGAGIHAAICDGYTAGFRIPDIASTAGVSPRTVNRVVRSAGLAPRRSAPRVGATTDLAPRVARI